MDLSSISKSSCFIQLQQQLFEGSFVMSPVRQRATIGVDRLRMQRRAFRRPISSDDLSGTVTRTPPCRQQRATSSGDTAAAARPLVAGSYLPTAMATINGQAQVERPAPVDRIRVTDCPCKRRVGCCHHRDIYHRGEWIPTRVEEEKDEGGGRAGASGRS
jgi:hypothetical protein